MRWRIGSDISMSRMVVGMASTASTGEARVSSIVGLKSCSVRCAASSSGGRVSGSVM